MNIEDVLNSHGFGASGGSFIKSIQTGSSFLSGTTVNSYVSINPVDLDSSLVEINYSPNKFVQAIIASKLMTSASFSTSSKICLARNTGKSSDPYPCIEWTVTEFNDVKSKQSGSSIFETTSDITTFNININPVNLQKCKLVASFRTSVESYNPPVYLPRYYMKDDSTITVRWFISSTTPENLYIEWQVIEFK